MNNITIHGNIGQQPELRFTNSGMAVLELNVGDSYGKDDKKKTTWHTVKVFGKLAENVAGTVNKGTTVLVTGRLETESYTKKDGSEGKFTKVIAEEVAVSCRWNMWVRDNTEAVVAQVGKVFASTDQNIAPGDTEPF